MPEMKNSNTIWLGNVPATWKISRIGSVYTLRNTKVSDRDYEPLSVTMHGIVPQLESAAKTNAHDDRKLVKKGDFAINSRSDRRGSCGIADRDGSVSLINTILCPNGEMNPRYYNWLFHTTQFADEFYANGHGIVDDLWTTGWPEMKRILIPLPPLEVQQSIANFLDQKCSEIDSLSTDIQSQIDVLEEYKKSVITEAVTKGLNPNVEMKYSGIEWIGSIPSHWDVSRIKYCLTNNDGGVWGNDPTDSNSDKVVLRSTEQTIDGHWDITDPAMRNIGKYCKQYRIICNDLLITKSSGSSLHIGKTTLADEYFNQHECYYSNFLQRLRVNKKILPKFLWYLMNNTIVREQFVLMQNSTIGIGNINSNNINEVYIPIPNIEEQNIINQHLDLKCAEIDAIIADKKAQLETLAEYKKSLIYEYVTGKKEVAENE